MTVPRLPSRREAPPLALPPVEAVDQLDAEALVAFATEAAALQARALARLALIAGGPPAASGDDEMLTAAAAAPLLGMSEDWVRRHGEREGLAVRVGRRTVRYSRRALARYTKRRAIT